MSPVLALALIARMQDPALTVAQRNDACYELRGETAPSIVEAMRKSLRDSTVRTCAGTNLRVAGAVAELQTALSDTDPEVRALALRQLGAFERPELLPSIAAAARDPQLIVAANAVEALANYHDPIVAPYLLDIAAMGGVPGAAALNRALTFQDPRVPAIGRELMEHPDISDKLAGMRALAEMGDAGDLPKLREIAQTEKDTVASQNRGFGLMPAISLSRAARETISRIEARLK